MPRKRTALPQVLGRQFLKTLKAVGLTADEAEFVTGSPHNLMAIRIRTLINAEMSRQKMIDRHGAPSRLEDYKFTKRMEVVLRLTREGAQEFKNEYVGTEHLLLGLLREGEGVAATVLQNLLVEYDDLLEKLEGRLAAGKVEPKQESDLSYTNRARKVLEHAWLESARLGPSPTEVGSEHLLLGLLLEPNGIAGHLLLEVGVSYEKAFAEILRILGIDHPYS